MAPFSFSLIATDLISTFYNKIPQFFLGRLYPADTLGSFDQAIKLKDQPTISAMQAVQSVTFPALAKIKDDAPKFAESYRQVVMVVSYVLFPVMLGMSARGARHVRLSCWARSGCLRCPISRRYVWWDFSIRCR